MNKTFTALATIALGFSLTACSTAAPEAPDHYQQQLNEQTNSLLADFTSRPTKEKQYYCQKWGDDPRNTWTTSYDDGVLLIKVCKVVLANTP